MKRILYLHASAELYGSDYVLLSLLKSLNNKEHLPFVILPFEGPLCDEIRKLDIDLVVHDLPVLRRQLFTPLGLLKFCLSFCRSFVFLIIFIFKNKIDLVHTNTSAIWVGGIVARLLRKHHIWQVMELIERPFIVSLFISKMVGIFSSRVFTISDAVKQHFTLKNQSRKAKFQTLYHGVDMNDYQIRLSERNQIRKQIGVDDHTIVVGMAGRINYWKGQDVFVNAIPRILEHTERPVHFLMLGSCYKGQEYYLTDLEKQIDDVGIQKNISLAGFQTNFSAWLSAMDIFILPSKLPEPNATVTIAAMAMRLPVIGTCTGGTSETIVDGQTGYLINPSDPDELSEKTLKLIKMNPQSRLSMGEKGHLRILAHFSMNNYCETIKEAYRS